MSKETDVLIVGSGPMGLSLACQLVRYGFGCIIITENGGSYTTIQSTDSQQTKYLAGCDGDGNSLQTAPDLHFIGNTFEEPFYVANIQLNWELPSNKLYIGRTRNSFIAFFPIQRTRIWQILGHLSNAVAEDEIHSTAIEDHVEIPLEIAGVNWFLIYRVLFRHVDQFSAAPASWSEIRRTFISLQGLRT